MADLKVKAVRSDGEVFNYENDEWGIHSLSGVDFPEIEISTKNRGQGNGVLIVGKRKKEREIDIVARVRRRKNSPAVRDRVIAFHNSNYTFDLYFEYLGTVRVAKECELSSASYPTKNIHIPPELTLMYISPEADLFADSKSATNMAATEAEWLWDRVYDGEDGTLIFDAISEQDEKIINYTGSEDVPLVIKITAGGYAKNITVTLNGNTFVVNTTLTAGDVLVISAETFTTKLNGVNITPGDIKGSYYDMYLKFGYNKIKIVSEEGGSFTSDLEYTGRYGGL